MATNPYNLHSTDSDGRTILVPRRVFVSDIMDITFIGKRTLEYGEELNENILHLLENFACFASSSDSSIPDPNSKLTAILNNPQDGQLWYNQTLEQLHIWYNSKWNPMRHYGMLSGNSGVIFDGEYIPIPVDEREIPYDLSECTINVSPMRMEQRPSSFECNVTATGSVNCKYTPIGGAALPASATYIILCSKS